MFLQKRADRPAQLSGAVAVDDPQFPEVGGHRFVEELLDASQRFVDGVADDIQLAQRGGSRLQGDVDANGGSSAACCAAGGRTRPAQIPEGGAEPLSADIDFRMLPMQFDDDAFEPECPDRNPRSNFNSAFAVGCSFSGGGRSAQHTIL